MKKKLIAQDRQFVFEMLDDFVADLETVVVYKLPAEIGGHAANQKVRFIPLESQVFNLLLSQTYLQYMENYFLEEITVDRSQDWEDSLLSKVLSI
ncbi:hypothetical protein STRDD10_00635 [Streptococcus sp. DD10]|uniref:hypothetical protein n=1 Tax=Streptococcus sp. DD10 TaxID=1777878 RepID=UPI000798C35B|nr:hypothetical protein [Streptococcus sp. DD10]KXT74855.1 hypothetical protein STRDD10_00635 [Streptococcus sp. DD10]